MSNIYLMILLKWKKSRDGREEIEFKQGEWETLKNLIRLGIAETEDKNEPLLK